MSTEKYGCLVGSLPPLSPISITFSPGGRSCLSIKADGTIEIGEGFTPTEAGKAAIEAMRWQLKFILDAETNACAKIASDAESWCRSFGAEETAERIASEILARKDKRP